MTTRLAFLTLALLGVAGLAQAQTMGTSSGYPLQRDTQQAIYQRNIHLGERISHILGGVQPWRVGLSRAAHRQTEHPTRVRGLHARHCVLNHQTALRRDAQLRRPRQEDIRRRLAVRHTLAGNRRLQPLSQSQ